MTDQETCPLCGCPEHRPLFSERNHWLVACSACGLLFVTPYPRRAHDVHSVVQDYNYLDLEIIAEDGHYRSSLKFYGDYYPKVRGELAQARSLLDVGCGTGRLLELAGEFPNLKREGIELNAARAAYARRVTGCTIHQVPVERLEPTEPWDVITLMNVFSHLPNVNEVFTALHKLLAPGGKLILKTGEMSPNTRKDAAYDWQIPDHLQFLGLNTIEFLAKKHRFRIVRHQRVPMFQELFTRSRWLAPGRSSLRNVIKRAVAYTPGALALMRSLYRLRHDASIYSSLIVLQVDRRAES